MSGSVAANSKMAEEAEKRFHDLMDKIFHSSKSNLSPPSPPSSVKAARGQKRPFSLLESKFRGGKMDLARNVPVEEPSCRPWERGDLIRRLATFKSMTWFAKPKVIDAVSCARRGWVNVELDTIACKLCGARLLFSTPSSWPREQVEKAAAVFSLKLDNGHKLLCPWVNNACDETLALFPPTPAPTLVYHYKQRSSALLHLSALPKISASAIEMMKILPLEHFLKESVKEVGVGRAGSPSTRGLGNNGNEMLVDLYCQALRLLSLCGWEPRLLPYIVGSNDNPSEAGEQGASVVVYDSGSCEPVQEYEDPSLSGSHYDPSSTVLECKLCKATVGLWMFSTVPQPMELLRVVGYAEISAGGLGNTNSGAENNTNSAASVNKTFPTLSLTIAGGPPPTNQNFRARISLPVIGRNLRARLAMHSVEGNEGEARDNLSNFTSEGSAAGTDHIDQASSHGGQIVDLVDHVERCNQGTSEPSAEICNTVISGPNHGSGISDEQTVGSTSQMIATESLSPPKAMSGAPNGVQNAHGVLDKVQTRLGEIAVTSNTSGDLQRSSNKEIDFHPIKQHRYFCPWVASTDSIAPGWKQTLLALEKEKVFSVPDSMDSPPSTTLIKVDDPIKSIRMLFNSPTKRLKFTRLSS